MDTSSLIAACGSSLGASRSIFRHAPANGWKLLSSPYALGEMDRNVTRFPSDVGVTWIQLRQQLTPVADVWVHHHPVVFDVPKDRPILFTAAAHASVLLTLDRRDFQARLGRSFYQLLIRKPSEFLEETRLSGEMRLVQP